MTKFLQNFSPVSYTHLDVYKRQEQNDTNNEVREDKEKLFPTRREREREREIRME